MKMAIIEPKRRLFDVVAEQGKACWVNNDLKPLFKHLLETHPGLEFLQATPEF